MDRTLYLNENERFTIHRDGSSIWVKKTGQAGRRIPARFVGRVVIIGNLRLESGAITLFTNNGIPVTFLSRRGDSLAVALPYNHQLPRHYEEQKIFLETEENTERFKRWISSKRKETQIKAIRRLSKWTAELFAMNGFRERDYQRFIEELKPSKDEKWDIVNSIISNLLREIIISRLVKADLDPHIGILHRRHNFGLALDLCHILSGDVDMQCIQFLRIAEEKGYIEKESGVWALSREGMKDIIHRFENNRVKLQEKVEKLIDDIFEIMRELMG